MSELLIVEKLKSLKDERAGGSPDAHWLASTKETLMMQIGNTVGQERRTGFRVLAENLRIFLPQNFTKALIAPLAMLLLVIGAGASSTALVAASHDTLPGQPLYDVKLAAEAISLRWVSRSARAERRLEIAGRRLEEMARLSASSDPEKDAKVIRVAALFSAEMSSIGKDLDDLQKEDDAEASVRVAMRIDAKADEYQALFKHGLSADRPSLRMALLSLDQVSVKALEILVEKQSIASNVLPEAQLTSAVSKKIDAFAAHVAVAQDTLVSTTGISSPSLLLTAKAKEAVEQAKQLFSQGDFRAAVRKVSEGTALVTEAETADKNPPPEVDVSATGTDTTATGTPSTP